MAQLGSRVLDADQGRLRIIDARLFAVVVGGAVDLRARAELWNGLGALFHAVIGAGARGVAMTRAAATSRPARSPRMVAVTRNGARRRARQGTSEWRGRRRRRGGRGRRRNDRQPPSAVVVECWTVRGLALLENGLPPLAASLLVAFQALLDELAGLSARGSCGSRVEAGSEHEGRQHAHRGDLLHGRYLPWRRAFSGRFACVARSVTRSHAPRIRVKQNQVGAALESPSPTSPCAATPPFGPGAASTPMVPGVVVRRPRCADARLRACKYLARRALAGADRSIDRAIRRRG